MASTRPTVQGLSLRAFLRSSCSSSNSPTRNILHLAFRGGVVTVAFPEVVAGGRSPQ
jgi:hypothetical protein